jgi:predicted nucleic acid-binding protein
MNIIDTDVLSELRKKRRESNVINWFETVPTIDLFLSTVTVFEIELGIEQQRRDNPAFANDLTAWLENILRLYGERVLPLTTNIARRWGRISGQVGNKNLDLAIAATALEHGLTVVTRNVAHYKPTGVQVFNPFERLGDR